MERDPLVPVECDLRGLQFMPLYGDRLFSSATWISGSAEEKIAALRLWWHAYAREVPASSLPDDDKLLAEYAGYGAAMKSWLKIKRAAMRGWVKCTDGRWYHPLVAELATEAWAGRVRNREKQRKWRERHQHKDGDVTVSKPFRNAREGQGQGYNNKTAAAAPPVDPVKEEIWKTGRAILAAEGMKTDRAGSFLGKLCKDYGQVLVLASVRDCAKATPAKPSEWLVARCQERRSQGLRNEPPPPPPIPCGNCGKPLKGEWTQSPKGKVCPDCHRGYMGAGWPERAAA